MTVNPAKTFRFKIALVQSTFPAIQLVQLAHQLHHATMIGLITEVPRQARCVIPFRPLAKIAAHEQQFFTRVQPLITEQQTQVGHFLPVITGHLAG